MTTLERSAGPAELAVPTRRLGTHVWKWVTTTDHKVIGHLYFITSMVFFFFAGCLAGGGGAEAAMAAASPAAVAFPLSRAWFSSS